LRKTLAPVAALLAVIAAAVAATAAIPDANGVIHACRNTKTGVLRVIDTDKGQTCSKNETALTWNQTGPQGPAGPAAVTSVRSIRHEILNVSPGQVYSAGFGCGPDEVASSPAVQQFEGTTPQQRETGLKWSASDFPATGSGWTGAAPNGYMFTAEAAGVQGDTLRFYLTCTNFS
jgi:hypothetical protein